MGSTDTLLSATLLACNDDAHIARTLASIEAVADEIVVVLDRKSEDRTETILRTFGQRWRDLGKERGTFTILTRRWTHNFSEARNQGLLHCTGKFVMVMDADDELSPGSRDRLRQVLQEDRFDFINCPLFLNATYAAPNCWDDEFGGLCAKDNRSRIFRMSLTPRYRGRVHEQPFLESSGDPEGLGNEGWEDIRFFHRGHQNDDKRDYYRSLLYLDMLDDPANPVPPIYLAEMALRDRNRVERALDFLDRVDVEAIQDGKRHRQIAANWYACLGKALQYRWANAKNQAEAQHEAMGEPIPDQLIKGLSEAAMLSIGAYRDAYRLSPAYTQAGIQACVMLIISQGIEGLPTAKEVLQLITNAEPANTVASSILGIVEGYYETVGDADDEETQRQAYFGCCRNLDAFLSDMHQAEVQRLTGHEGGTEGIQDGIVSLESLQAQEVA